MLILAVDPGSRKSGMAVVSSEDGLLRHTIVKVEDIPDTCARWAEDYVFDAVIVGGSTGSKRVGEMVGEALNRRVEFVDERHTTERAKLRYFADNPPRGLKRLIPLGLQYPPVPFDDYAAVVMAEDYIENCGSSDSPQ